MPRGATSTVATVLLLLAMVGVSPACGVDSSAPPADTSSANSSYPAGSEVGNRAPDFTLTLSDGQTVSLASLRDQGRPVVLYFFATW